MQPCIRQRTPDAIGLNPALDILRVQASPYRHPIVMAGKYLRSESCSEVFSGIRSSFIDA
jgi:hypothetical protein